MSGETLLSSRLWFWPPLTPTVKKNSSFGIQTRRLPGWKWQPLYQLFKKREFFSTSTQRDLSGSPWRPDLRKHMDKKALWNCTGWVVYFTYETKMFKYDCSWRGRTNSPHNILAQKMNLDTYFRCFVSLVNNLVVCSWVLIACNQLICATDRINAWSSLCL